MRQTHVNIMTAKAEDDVIFWCFLQNIAFPSYTTNILFNQP